MTASFPPLEALRHRYGPALLAIGLGLFLVVLSYAWRESHNPKETAAPVSGPSVNTTGFADTRTITTDRRIARYVSNLDKFSSNISLQALLIVIAILLIARPGKPLSLFGNRVPLSWLHVFVPLLLLFLWLEFGFLLHQLIWDRTDGVLGGLDPSVFKDAGFIDGWFKTFNDAKDNAAHSGIDRTFGGPTATFLVFVLGTLVAAAHASLFAVVIVGCRRYCPPYFRGRRWLAYLLPLVPLSLIVMSHLQFRYGGPNQNWLQAYVLGAAPVLTLALIWLSNRVDRPVDHRPDDQHFEPPQRRRFEVVDGPLWLTDRHDSEGRPKYLTVALIGDSLSTSFHIDRMPKVLWLRAKTWQDNWFYRLPHDDDDSGGTRRSLVAQIAQYGTVRAFQHATTGGGVNSKATSWIGNLINSRSHLSHQVDEMLRGPFPDLTLIWIGHNDIDWRQPWGPDHRKPESLEPRDIKERADAFVAEYRKQLMRIIHEGAQINTRSKTDQQRSVAIVVFGLTNFRGFFKAREAIEESPQRKKEYPNLERCYDYFDAMRPEYRETMAILASAINTRLEEMCADLKSKLPSHMRLMYSDVFSKAAIRPESLSKCDAWHPSVEGHRMMAQAASPVVEELVEFLGWKPRA